MRSIGIVGLPYSGKSTLFAALTRVGSAGGRANQAVVDVPDERLHVLAEMESSRKVVAAKVRFVDVPGGLTPQGVAEFRQMDALCLVAGVFADDAEPVRDLETLRTELVLADLTVAEGALEKARKRARGTPEARVEVEALERAIAVLEQERTLREAGIDETDRKALRSLAPLTLKPWIVVANVAEGEQASSVDGAIVVSAALEAEVAGVDAAEAAELLGGFGIERPGLERVIEASYRALDLITFLTTGADETRAWEVRRGAPAPEAAGAIHSDLQRGFIRAEVIGYEDLVAAGSWSAAKSAGALRVEGKDYVVQEGDVMNVRFAV